jgi:DNA-binding transcriptional LysR family regulator
LLCYTHSRVPIHLDDTRHSSLLAGMDGLILVSVPNPAGGPQHDLRGRKTKSASLVAYSPTSFLGRVLDSVQRPLHKAHELSVQGVADRSEVVRAMVLEGFGAGWIPASMIAEDLTRGRLVPAGASETTVELQIRVFSNVDNRSSFVGRVWDVASRISPLDYVAELRKQSAKAVARRNGGRQRRGMPN